MSWVIELVPASAGVKAQLRKTTEEPPMSDSMDSNKSQDEATESRRNFLKQAGVAGLGVGTASVTGLAGVAVASGDAEAAEGGPYGSPVSDPSREDLA